MSPDSIWKDDINRANEAKRENNKSENQIVAKEFEQQTKPNNKPSYHVASEIKLKSGSLLVTKSDIDDLDFSKSVCYAFLCKEALFSFEDVPSSLPPAVTNILQEFTDVFPQDVCSDPTRMVQVSVLKCHPWIGMLTHTVLEGFIT